MRTLIPMDDPYHKVNFLVITSLVTEKKKSLGAGNYRNPLSGLLYIYTGRKRGGGKKLRAEGAVAFRCNVFLSKSWAARTGNVNKKREKEGFRQRRRKSAPRDTTLQDAHDCHSLLLQYFGAAKKGKKPERRRGGGTIEKATIAGELLNSTF